MTKTEMFELNSTVVNSDMELDILRMKTLVVDKVTGVKHTFTNSELGGGKHRVTISAPKELVMNQEYALKMIEATIFLLDLEQIAMAMDDAAIAQIQAMMAGGEVDIEAALKGATLH